MCHKQNFCARTLQDVPDTQFVLNTSFADYMCSEIHNETKQIVTVPPCILLKCLRALKFLAAFFGARVSLDGFLLTLQSERGTKVTPASDRDTGRVQYHLPYYQTSFYKNCGTQKRAQAVRNGDSLTAFHEKHPTIFAVIDWIPLTPRIVLCAILAHDLCLIDDISSVVLHPTP